LTLPAFLVSPSDLLVKNGTRYLSSWFQRHSPHQLAIAILLKEASSQAPTKRVSYSLMLRLLESFS